MRFIISFSILFMAYLAYVNSESCVQCNSAKDVACAVSPETFSVEECRNSSSSCYTRVDKEGHTIRGCTEELDKATASNCNNEMECLICNFTAGCNRQPFPLHRAACLQCSGNNENSSCATDIYRRPTYCPIYKLEDKCFIRRDDLNKSNSVQRGCLSNAEADGFCKNISNCYTCEGFGCNVLEINSTVIPLARDSAVVYGTSLLLLLFTVITSRFF